MSTILVTGANGQLGNEMRNMSLLDDANKYIFTDVRELDINDLVAVQKIITENAGEANRIRAAGGGESVII